jgi:hypothetical protein
VGPRLSIADSHQNAAAGSASFAIAGDFPRAVTGRAGAFEQGSGPGATVTVIDAFAVDAHGVPTAELFIFATSSATVRQLALAPVTLAQLHDTEFIPSGSLAVYAEQYDATVKDYTRWLVAKTGTVNITTVSSGDIGRVGVTVSLAGEWVDQSGTALGCGTIADARIDAPLLRLRTVSNTLGDTLTAQFDGARDDALGTDQLASFQVLNDARQRLLVAGSATPADSTMELWLSLNGIPASGDSIVLGAPSLDEAVAGRASVSFGMLRVGPSTSTTATALWRSTGGYVTLTDVVQMGPLALCGWASGHYSFDAAGVDLTADTALAGTLSASGAFESRFTVVAPADTLAASAATSLTSRFARLAMPARTSGVSCTF